MVYPQFWCSYGCLKACIRYFTHILTQHSSPVSEAEPWQSEVVVDGGVDLDGGPIADVRRDEHRLTRGKLNTKIRVRDNNNHSSNMWSRVARYSYFTALFGYFRHFLVLYFIKGINNPL